MNAKLVIRIGRSRCRPPPRGVEPGRPGLPLLLGELHDQDRVLARQPDQHHQPDLGEDVQVRAAGTSSPTPAPHRAHIGTISTIGQRQQPALVQGGQHQERDQGAQAEHQHRRVPRGRRPPRGRPPRVFAAASAGTPCPSTRTSICGGQLPLGQRLHLGDRLPGADHPGVDDPVHVGRRVHLVPVHLDRPVRRLARTSPASGTIAPFGALTLSRPRSSSLVAEPGVGLDVHLPVPVEQGDVVHVVEPEVRLQGVVHRPDGQPELLDPLAGPLRGTPAGRRT